MLASPATALTRCSQLSRISRAVECSSAVMIWSTASRPGASGMSSVDVTTLATPEGPATVARSINQMSFRELAAWVRATSCASRVLPTPPLPINERK